MHQKLHQNKPYAWSLWQTFWSCHEWLSVQPVGQSRKPIILFWTGRKFCNLHLCLHPTFYLLVILILPETAKDESEWSKGGYWSSSESNTASLCVLAFLKVNPCEHVCFKIIQPALFPTDEDHVWLEGWFSSRACVLKQSLSIQKCS